MYECEYESTTCMTVSLYDCITVYNLMRQDWTGKMGSELTLQCKHSTIFIGDDTVGEGSNH